MFSIGNTIIIRYIKFAEICKWESETKKCVRNFKFNRIESAETQNSFRRNTRLWFRPSPTIKTLLRPLMGILDAFRPAHKYLQYIVRGSGVSPIRTHILHTECDKSFINIVDVLASAESFSLHNLPTINKSCRLSVFLVPRHPFSPPMHPLVAVCIST